jgi:hypothetical protein
MKLLRATSLAFILLALLAPALPTSVASAADEKCACVCCESKSVGDKGYVIVDRVAHPWQCKDGGKRTPAQTVDNESACRKLCNNIDGFFGYTKDTCTRQDCWCLDGTSPKFMDQTADQATCEQLCTEKKLKFGNWSSPPNVTSSAVQCPPGGMWEQQECEAVTDPTDPKVYIGDWAPPDEGFSKGPYCFVKQPPIKLNVAVGGITVATLADYLAAAFKLGIGIAAVLAVLMIMIGGFRYIMAAGGSGISGAKDMIKHAVIGLLLTVSAYTLLQTVNPDITTLKLPRVQIVKPCSVNVSCASKRKENCEKNDPNSGMRCVWSITQSYCYDNSVFESGALGKNGGECMKGSDGGFFCTDGSKCIKIDSNTYRCSKGNSCQSCKTDGDCSSASGAPGKCGKDNTCLIPDPKGQPGAYLKCGNGACKANTECDTGFCNGSGRCAASGQGTGCMINGDKDCAVGYKCIQFTQKGTVVSKSSPVWKAACCLDGDGKGCLGCDPLKTPTGSDTNSDCPDNMACDKESSTCVAKST